MSTLAILVDRTPPRRSTSRSQVHSDVAAKLLSACAAGRVRREACVNTQATIAAASQAARTATERKLF
jgi:hypothetical protein